MRSYEEQARRSIRRDFRGAHFLRRGERRVKLVNEKCEYWKFRRLIEGRAVKIMSETLDGVWVRFVHNEDRIKLNRAAGWSNNKQDYLLQGAVFE